jgi:hypothetical protein
VHNKTEGIAFFLHKSSLFDPRRKQGRRFFQSWFWCHFWRLFSDFFWEFWGPQNSEEHPFEAQTYRYLENSSFFQNGALFRKSVFFEISVVQKRAPGSSREAPKQRYTHSGFEKCSFFKFFSILDFRRKYEKQGGHMDAWNPPDRYLSTSSHPDTNAFNENFDLRRKRAKTCEN